ncbi:ABC transporter substrate-binding protein [Pseudoalteromonas sp. SSDWG2]|uniref:ABC transporter substrate-binding protein n=1 Tax=Pseudoalteromonas sp. SSDWG2 TaxID=3139391 RepID=UPI003BABBC40
MCEASQPQTIEHPTHSMKVHFVNPGHQSENATGMFWRNVSIAMHAAADDLNIDLVTTYANRNHILMKQKLQQALSSDADYVIVVDEKKALTQYFKQIENVNKPVLFIFNAPDADLLTAKPHWLSGYLTPNTFDAGYKLAHSIYKTAKERFGEQASLNLLALYGDHRTESALGRQHGLELFLRQHPEINLIHSDVANWSKEQGFRKSIGVLNHTPSINMIWAANDPIASGALLAAKRANPTNLPVIGGINWDEVDAQEQAEISVGGHVLLGAASLVLLYDAHTTQTPFPSSSNYEIFAPNSAEYQQLIDAMHTQQLGKVNFQRFSVSHEDSWQYSLLNLSKCVQNGC